MKYSEHMRRDKNWRVYRTAADARRAIAQLRKRGYNYFVHWHEASVPGHPHGLQFAKAAWVTEAGGIYINW